MALILPLVKPMDSTKWHFWTFWFSAQSVLAQSFFWAKVGIGPKYYWGQSECRPKVVLGPNWVWADSWNPLHPGPILMMQGGDNLSGSRKLSRFNISDFLFLPWNRYQWFFHIHHNYLRRHFHSTWYSKDGHLARHNGGQLKGQFVQIIRKNNLF